jgi:brefeldin A-inhibited guanine nucleotide-exchange protein
MPVEQSAMNVFYVNALQKIMKEAGSKYKELKDKCTETLNNLKTLEKNKANILAELSTNINKYFRPLELACATRKPQIVEVALDCLQKLMAYKFIDLTTKYTPDPSKLLIDIVVATICNCFEPNQDDNVQLQIVKALLTAVTSCDIRGKSVRITVKTSFNIHLVSKNPVNQKIGGLSVCAKEIRRCCCDFPKGDHGAQFRDRLCLLQIGGGSKLPKPK